MQDSADIINVFLSPPSSVPGSGTQGVEHWESQGVTAQVAPATTSRPDMQLWLKV